MLLCFYAYLELLSVAFLCDDVSCAPSMLQRPGTICDKLNTMLHLDRQLMLHVVARHPNAIAIPGINAKQLINQ